MSIIQKIKHKWRYRQTWSTPIGKDCISLDTSLCRWLGERLVFMSDHANSFDPSVDDIDAWKRLLYGYGHDLLAWTQHWDCETAEDERAVYERAQVALHWVADNLGTLWD